MWLIFGTTVTVVTMTTIDGRAVALRLMANYSAARDKSGFLLSHISEMSRKIVKRLFMISNYSKWHVYSLGLGIALSYTEAGCAHMLHL